jgi:ankyrin repeat protein
VEHLKNDHGIVWLLLEKGANPDAVGWNGDTMMACTLQHGHEQIVQLLLKKGADINATGGYPGPTLAGASSNGHEQIVCMLFVKVTDVNAAKLHGETALETALQN